MASLASTLKNFAKPSGHTNSEGRNATGTDTVGQDTAGDRSSVPHRNATTTSHKLPPGTGPGTTGKPGSESAMERSREQERSVPGVLTTDRGTTVGSSAPTTVAPVSYFGTTADQDRHISRGTERSGLSHFIDELHQHGHSTYNTRDVMPSGDTEESTAQLNPVTHERVRYLETEEVQRVKDIDRHVHHIQHHIQPVFATETLQEEIKEIIHPETKVREFHSNKLEDTSLFEGQIRQHNDTITHLDRDRTIIDKGVTVRERVIHHVHHVIQPIIEKETIAPQRIRTIIPIREEAHEAPIVHQSQTHDRVPIEHFIQRGGLLRDAISNEQIGSRLLRTGQCTREVDGVADSISKELHLTETSNDAGGAVRDAYHSEPREAYVGPGSKQNRQSDIPTTMPMA